MPKKWFHRRDDAGSMLATVIVVGLGAGLSSFLVLAGSSSDYDWIVLGVFVTALVMLGGVTFYRYYRNEDPNLGFWNAVARNHREEGLAAQYRPRSLTSRHVSAHCFGRFARKRSTLACGRGERFFASHRRFARNPSTTPVRQLLETAVADRQQTCNRFQHV